MKPTSMLTYLLGSYQPSLFLAAVIAAFIGIALNLSVKVMRRDPNAPGSPVAFNWRHLWCSNNRRIVASCVANTLAVLVFLRFTHDLMGQDLSMLAAFTIGFSFDALIGRLQSMVHGS